ncbi:MAG: rhodanese-like domain-containing protein [Deltaproteobacteria bacterium]|nr:rhodanese-like domain-containing protein [Deltaproteobacteria bacterium]
MTGFQKIKAGRIMLQNSIVQVLLIIIAGIFIGVASNHIRGNPLPWIAKPAVVKPIPGTAVGQDPGLVDPSSPDFFLKFESGSTFDAYYSVSIEQVYGEIFLNKSGVFMDARHAEKFQEAHIKGAINIPYNEVWENIERLDDIAPDELIIVYCDGAECEASKLLTQELLALGYTRVFLFDGGWLEWIDAGHPVE